jgi:lipoprotein-anchoring transpeptidase ErfK/SrfK
VSSWFQRGRAVVIIGLLTVASISSPNTLANGQSNPTRSVTTTGTPARPGVTRTTKSRAKKTVPPAKVAEKFAAKAAVKAAAPQNPKRVTLPPTPKNVKERAITETWTVSKSLEGWDVIDGESWPESGRALVIEAREPSIEVRQAPSVGAPGLKFAKGRSTTGPVTFLAVRDYGEWVQVLLPVRPNGTVGWVRGKEVSRIAVTHRIMVDLSANSLQIEHEGVVVGTYPVSSGTGGTPTPTGLFYIRELVVQARTDGPYGPFVFGLSGYSEVLNDFDGGEGAIGIHGTNRPDAIGDSVSHGCVRLTNETLLEISRTLPLGTPVEIVRSLADLPSKRRVMAEPEVNPAAPTAPGGIVIDFPLEPVPVPKERLEDVDIVDVGPPNSVPPVA